MSIENLLIARENRIATAVGAIRFAAKSNPFYFLNKDDLLLICERFGRNVMHEAMMKLKPEDQGTHLCFRKSFEL